MTTSPSKAMVDQEVAEVESGLPGSTSPLEVLRVERTVVIEVRAETRAEEKRIEAVVADARARGFGIRIVDLGRSVSLACPSEREGWLLRALAGEI